MNDKRGPTISRNVIAIEIVGNSLTISALVVLPALACVNSRGQHQYKFTEEKSVYLTK